jgi:hypothetical protein
MPFCRPGSSFRCRFHEQQRVLSERFQAKSIPVRVKKTRQTSIQSFGSHAIRTEHALDDAKKIQ